MTLIIEGEKMNSLEEIYDYFSHIVPESMKEIFLSYGSESGKAYRTIAVALKYIDDDACTQKELQDKYDVQDVVIRDAVKQICFEYGLEYPNPVYDLEEQDGEPVLISRIEKRFQNRSINKKT